MKLLRFLTAIILLFSVFNPPFVVAQDEAEKDTTITLEEALKNNQYSLRLDDSQLKGEGGDWLRKQAAEATIVTIGESHGTKEIPAIISALIYHLQHENEFDHLALEVSSWTVELMTNQLRKGKDTYEKFISRYPVAVPFYNFKTERDLVHQVVQDSDVEKPLWGMDQIFAFSTSLALDRLKELAPSVEAQSAVQEMREAGKSSSTDDSRLQKLPPGIPAPIAVYKPAAFDTLRSYFENVDEAQRILAELAKSVEIYRTTTTITFQTRFALDICEIIFVNQ